MILLQYDNRTIILVIISSKRFSIIIIFPTFFIHKKRKLQIYILIFWGSRSTYTGTNRTIF